RADAVLRLSEAATLDASGASWRELAVLATEAGDFARAAHAWDEAERALDQPAARGEALASLGELGLRLGDPARARTACTAALQRAAGGGEALLRTLERLAADETTAEGERAAALREAATLHAAAGHPDEAARCARAVLELAPGDLAMVALLARLIPPESLAALVSAQLA